MKRRGLLIAGSVVGLYLSGRAMMPMLRDIMAGPFVFEPIDGAPGYRRVLRTGADISSANFDPLIGLAAEGEIAPAALGPLRADLADALVPEHQTGTPVAIFTDYNCPYCRVMEDRLVQIDRQISVQFHNLPLLGDRSVIGAKAAIAAGLQQDYPGMHRELMRAGLAITHDYVAGKAISLGLDPKRLLIDMEGIMVRNSLAKTKALAQIFGVRGTPGMVVGRSFVAGVISDARLRQLIDLER